MKLLLLFSIALAFALIAFAVQTCTTETSGQTTSLADVPLIADLNPPSFVADFSFEIWREAHWMVVVATGSIDRAEFQSVVNRLKGSPIQELGSDMNLTTYYPRKPASDINLAFTHDYLYSSRRTNEYNLQMYYSPASREFTIIFESPR